MDPKILFEDEDILVLDKPAGWIVNEAQTTTSQPVIQTWLKTNFKYSICESAEYRSGVVHRLDKETSGILLVAKNQNSFENLQKQFKERIVKKTYTALAHGKIDPPKGRISVAVGRLPWRRERFGVLPGGRESETDYQVLRILSGKENDFYTLVELYPKTGRTHQIRIHLKYLGHPIVADEFYAGRKTARKDRQFCPRLFLHAGKITFLHPSSGNEISFQSDLPQDLRQVLLSLQ